MPIEHRPKDYPKHGGPSSYDYPARPPSGNDKPKEKRNKMSLIMIGGLLALNSVVFYLIKETAGISPAFCGSGLIALDIALIKLRKKIISASFSKKK